MRDYYNRAFKIRALENIKKGELLNLNLSSLTVKPYRENHLNSPTGIALRDIKMKEVIVFYKTKETSDVKPIINRAGENWMKINKNS
jgi:hypothetical protein